MRPNPREDLRNARPDLHRKPRHPRPNRPIVTTDPLPLPNPNQVEPLMVRSSRQGPRVDPFAGGKSVSVKRRPPRQRQEGDGT